MKDTGQTREQLLRELTESRQQLAQSQQLERLTRTSKEFYENIAVTIPKPLVVLNAGLRIVTVNPAFNNTFQVTSDETEGHLLYELGNLQWDIPQLRELLEQVLPQQTEFHDFEVVHDFEGIGRKTVLLSACQIQDGDVGTNLILLTIEDITERRQSEKALREIEHRLQENSRLASLGLLAAGMTHELNNPLGIILGFSELALSEDLSPKVQHYIQTIHSQTERAARIIRNALSFASGNPLTKTRVEVPHILERVIGLKSHELEIGNISVITEFSPDLPAISGDPFQLIEALLSIITNAQQAMTEAHVGGRIII